MWTARKGRTMRLPKIEEIVTTEWARELCAHFGYAHLVERIDNTPDQFLPWKFDGASMTPDVLVAKIAGIPNLTEIALEHDLKYAYGDPGNEKAERGKADREFRADLLADGAGPVIAKAMYQAVRRGGNPPVRTSFSWGFARK
jgi:hypothetical protein